LLKRSFLFFTRLILPIAGAAEHQTKQQPKNQGGDKQNKYYGTTTIIVM
jgi:hypothetical protein